MEPVKMIIPSKGGVSFVINTEIPICSLPEHSHFSCPIGGRVSRLARAHLFHQMLEAVKRPSRELEQKAIEASEEFVEFLNHIRKPRVTVG